MKEKKMYAWTPSNCELFHETYDSIEEAVEEAQKQWDEKYEYYEEDDENDTEISLLSVRQFNPEKHVEHYGEELIEKLNEDLGDFTYGIEAESEVYCKDVAKFNKAVKEALMPLIKEHLSFYMDMVGDHFNITYDVKTRKYTWQGKEYDSLPDAFKDKEG